MSLTLPLELLALPHQRAVPFARLSTLGIGGTCDYLFEPTTAAQAQTFVRACAREAIPFRILGAGSNIVSLGDIAEPVLRLQLPPGIRAEGRHLHASAACGLVRLANAAADAGLAGLEWACGIPGSCGGALRMNAGAVGSALADTLVRICYLTPEGERVERAPALGDFAYRTSFLRNGHLALGLELALAAGDPGELRDRMAALRARRSSTQPLNARSAGCTFKNPPGEAAGRLIDSAGLKGLQVGKVQVSSCHANFLVNLGGATPTEWLELVARIREEVQRVHSVPLDLEVEVWPASTDGP